MDDIYREQIIDHYKNPRNFGSFDGGSDKDLVIVKEANASCGDLFELGVRFKNNKEKAGIEEVRFSGVGCAIATAAMSMVTEKIRKEKLKVRNIEKLRERDMVEMLGIEVSPTRMKCATLPLRALRNVLRKGIAGRQAVGDKL